MRTQQEVLKEFEEETRKVKDNIYHQIAITQFIQLKVLLDIRDLLTKE